MLLTTIQQLVWCSKSHVRLIFEKRKWTVQFHEGRFYIIVCRICCNLGKTSQLFCQYWDFAKLHLSHKSIDGLGQHHVDHTLRWWQFNWQLSFAEISTESCKIKLVRAGLAQSDIMYMMEKMPIKMRIFVTIWVSEQQAMLPGWKWGTGWPWQTTIGAFRYK